MFSVKGWFGIRKDFCDYLLGMVPCLQEYGNTSYKFPDSFITEAITEDYVISIRTSPSMQDVPKQTVPILRIDVPD